MKPPRKLPSIALTLLLAVAMPAWCQTEVNTATEAQLDMILGLGPATTRRILAERERGPFRNWSELMKRVQGIGPNSAIKLSASGLQVNGKSYEPAP
jgi:competence protein ComEA